MDTAGRRLSAARVAWAGALSFAVLVQLPNLVIPLFEDTALFAAIGRWMGQGLLPYRDIADQKPPGIYLLAALVHAVLGDSSLAYRLTELLFLVAMSLACGLIVAKLAGDRCGPWATALTALGSSAVFWQLPDRGQVEFFQAAFSAGAVLLVLRFLETERLRTLIGAGALVALACWFKPQAAALGLAFAVLVLGFLVAKRRARKLVPAGGALLAGVLAVSLPILAWMAACGILGSFWRTMFVGNLAYVRRAPTVPFSVAAQGAFFYPALGHASGALLSVAIVVAIGWMVLVNRHPLRLWHAGLLAWWLASGFIQFRSGGYLFAYQRAVMIPAITCLVALAGVALVEGCRAALAKIDRQRAAMWLAWSGAVAVLLAGVSSAELRPFLGGFFDWVSGRAQLSELHARLGHELYYFDFGAQKAMADYVREHSGPGDTVQVIGRAGVTYLYSGRAPATRYVVTSGLFEPDRADPRAHAEFLAQLAERRPAFVLVRTKDRFPWFGLPESAKQIEHDASLLQLFQRLYAYEGRYADDFIVFRRVAAAPPAQDAGGSLARP